MPPLPRPLIHGESGPIYIKESLKGAPMTGHVLSNLRVTATDTSWAAVIDNNVPHHDDDMHDLEIVGVGDNKWGVRRYKVTGSRKRVVVRNITKEHAFYESPGEGTLLYEDCAGINIGAQFIQIRHTGNRTDPMWNLNRLVHIRNCQAREVGLASGAGRAGFAVSVKDMGPHSDVVIQGVWIRTIKQTAVKVYNGVTYNSFGAICVEYCRSLLLENFHIEMRPPSDRDAIQLYDYKTAPTMNGPDKIVVRRGEILRGGNMSVRVGDGSSIDIGKIQGDGWIKVHEKDHAGVWRHSKAQSKRLTEGFKWSK